MRHADTAEKQATPQILERAEGSDTMLAWERFLTGDPSAPVPTRNFVVSSWLRSREFGVDPTSRAAPLATASESVSDLRERHSDLLAASCGVFSDAAYLLAGTRSILLLTTSEGVVIEAVGDAQTLEDGQAIHLMHGGDWREEVIGTNGIGTALITGRPAQVHAAEHFCEGIKTWTCAAAPVLDPVSGVVLGIVDISGPPSTYQRSNLTLAMTIARQIEMAIAQRLTRERTRLLEACLDRLTDADAAGLLAIDRDGRVVHRAGRLPGPGSLRIGQRLPGLGDVLPVEKWSELLPNWVQREWFNPVSVGGQTIGAMVVVPRPAKLLPGRGAVHHSEADPARGSFAGIVGESPAIRTAIARACTLAGKRVPVLIEGETGVGKELFARAIHGDGPQPFIAYNCGAVSKELVASDLFGHVRGAYTGATSEGRPGRFELANGGTLCLDEIGELPPDVQPLLLRALEEAVVYRLGDAQPRRLDVRVLALTNRDLGAEVRVGRFRADLFYRIAVTRLRIPRLAEHADDIGLLIDRFNRILTRRHNVPPRSFSAEALDLLCHHHWPGNVRELRNLVEGLLLSSATGDVSCDEVAAVLDPSERTGSIPGTEPCRLADVEKALIGGAIRQSFGNLSKAAQLLGISRSTLYRKAGRYGIGRPQAGNTP
jgi:transcriptional regulator of acetoin/glycerol metabolism